MSHRSELIKNIINFGSIDILGLIIPIVTMPILTRALGPSQYGEYMLLLTIIYLGQTIVDYGTQYTSVRFISQNRNVKERVDQIYQDTQGLRVFLCLVYTLCVILYCIFVSIDTLFPYVVFMLLTYLLGYAFTPLWFYQGIGAVDKAIKVSLIIKALNVIVIVFFIEKPDDFIIVIMSLCIPMLFGGVYLSFLASYKYKVGRPKFNNLCKSLHEGRDVFIGLLAPNFYNSIPTIALGTIYPPAQFANFAIATRLASVIVVMQNVLAKAVYPIITRTSNDQVKTLMLVNFFISIIPILLVVCFGKEILNILLGHDFSGVEKYLLALCLGVLFVGLTNSISQGYFLPHGYDRIYRNISLRVSFFSGILSIIIIYFYGLFGGAIAITVARILFFIDYWLSYYICRRN
ncbi:oligosaccharide flippase family protein [Edwardsiella tarda]